MRTRARKGLALFFAILAGWPGLADAIPFEVDRFGMTLGTLEVVDYTATHTGTAARATITANFDNIMSDGTPIDPGARQFLSEQFPEGLTYLQTTTIVTDQQQAVFRSVGGSALLGTFSDPPVGGYSFPGGFQVFSDDPTPWYANLEPVMDPINNPGALPPDGNFSLSGGPSAAQYFDRPRFPFPDFSDGTDGLASLLNGQDGQWQFETALVGVMSKPVDDPQTLVDERLIESYSVMALAVFDWGLDFQFLDDGIAGLTPSDYLVSPTSLEFSVATSAQFRAAFDQNGVNAPFEWLIDFVLLPEPGTFWLLLCGLACLGHSWVRGLKGCHFTQP